MRLVQVLQQLVRLAVQDLVAALHGQQRERLRGVALAGARRADEQGVLAGIDE